MMTLDVLLKLAEVTPVRVEGEAMITALEDDSRQVGPGALIVCMPGMVVDTHDYLPPANAAGAVAAIVHSDSGFEIARHLGLAAIQLSHNVADFNRDLGRICREFHMDPALDLRIIGVTGTNGKTTVAWALRQSLRALGREAAYIGTLGYQGAGDLESISNTTPFPVGLWKLISRARQEGCTDVVMEVSSHALHQFRVSGVRFDLGAYTHLSQDHLDYHGTMESYAEAKKLLFTEFAAQSEKPFIAVLNTDDLTGNRWAREWACDPSVEEESDVYKPALLTYGIESGTVRASNIQFSLSGCAFELVTAGGTSQVAAGLGGEFSAWNLLTAGVVLSAMGFSVDAVAAGLSSVTAVPGRFEAISNGADGPIVIVDYAHTEDAMDKLLASVRASNPTRMTCVFGCGGDRDRTKRSKMAAVSAKHCEHTILTSDNPRTEPIAEIFKDLESGMKPTDSYEIIEDRALAIQTAIENSIPGEAIVVAGKGHETYQIFGKNKVPFDDREVARAALGAFAKV